MTRTTLQPGQRDGLFIPEARGWRIRASPDGRVIEELPGGTSRTIAEPGDVDAVVTVRAGDLRGRLKPFPIVRLAKHEVVSLLGDDRVLLTVPLMKVQPDRHVKDIDAIRRATGIQDFAQTLGLPLQRADADQVRRVNDAHHALRRGPVTTALRRRVIAHIALVCVWVAAMALEIVLNNTGERSLPLLTITFGVSLGLLALSTFTLTARFVRGLPEPDVDGTRLTSAAIDHPWAWVRRSTLVVGAHDIVWRLHAREGWTPGPANGGAVTCTISPDAIILRDRHDTPLLIVPAFLFDHDEIRRACTAAGITVAVRDHADLPHLNGFDFSPEYYPQKSSLLYTIDTPLARGVPLFIEGSFIALAGIVTLGVGLAPIVRPASDPTLPAPDAIAIVVGVVTAVIGALSSASSLLSSWRLRRWVKNQTTAP